MGEQMSDQFTVLRDGRKQAVDYQKVDDGLRTAPPRAPAQLMSDDENRCPACRHWWMSHGSEPDTEGCGIPTSSLAERERDQFQVCGCQERPEPGSEWAKQLALDATWLRIYVR